MEHLEENTIIGYAGGGLDRAERRRVEQHIDQCAECRQTLAVFVGGSSTPYAGAIQSSPSSATDDSVLVDMPKPGDRLADRFTIGDTLGRGGMGYVFRATDDDLGIQVALKVLRPELTIDEERVRHLRREILAGRKITHPNVCRIYDLGKGDERLLFITMELCTGGTLADLLRTGPVASERVVELLDQLLLALAAAHAEGIVHRDLKPANVMFDEAGKLKVMDFGLARDLKGDHSLKGHVGTPAYWSPEQARGEAAGPAADLYAVGVLAYLLLTGETSPRKLPQRLDRVAPLFRAWIARCLEDEPTDRFADARSARDALLALAPNRAQSRIRAVLAIAAAVTTLAVIGGIWVSRSDDARPGSAGPARYDADAPVPPIADATVITAGDAAIAIDATVAIDALRIDAAIRRVPRDARVVAAPDAGLPAVLPDASLLYER